MLKCRGDSSRDGRDKQEPNIEYSGGGVRDEVKNLNIEYMAIHMK